MADSLDMENRDPNNINGHLGCNFEDVLGEPSSSHSADCVWRNSYKCYTCGLDLCYKILTYLCGICAALYWGCVFACLSFEHIWCITPACKAYMLIFYVYQRLNESLMHGCIGPCCTTCGLCLSKIVVTQKSG